MPINFGEYQREALKAAIYPEAGNGNWEYPLVGLCGEVGEVANRLKKVMCGDRVMNNEVASELGDVLWYMAMLAKELGLDMQDIAVSNLKKLAHRKRQMEVAESLHIKGVYMALDRIKIFGKVELVGKSIQMTPMRAERLFDKASVSLYKPGFKRSLYVGTAIKVVPGEFGYIIMKAHDADTNGFTKGPEYQWQVRDRVLPMLSMKEEDIDPWMIDRHIMQNLFPGGRFGEDPYGGLMIQDAEGNVITRGASSKLELTRGVIDHLNQRKSGLIKELEN